MADLKQQLGGPMVINMSLGGSRMDAVEQAAIDYAIEKGVVIVAAAGNEGVYGMGYPAAYPPVISVAASGWIGEWMTGSWWLGDVADPTYPEDFYITDFSSRAIEQNHDLDVAAPGSWIVGPYAVNQGNPGYFYMGGTSMACPHVAGAVALLLQKSPELTAPDVESKIESSAIPLAAGSRTVYSASGISTTFSWGDNATGHGLLDVSALLAK